MPAQRKPVITDYGEPGGECPPESGEPETPEQQAERQAIAAEVRPRGWHVYRGLLGMLYARRGPAAHPETIVRGISAAELGRAIAEREARDDDIRRTREWLGALAAPYRPA